MGSALCGNHGCGRRKDGSPRYVFIWNKAHDYWERAVPNKIGKREVVRCVYCTCPATTVDCHFPYMHDYNRCDKHQNAGLRKR